MTQTNSKIQGEFHPLQQEEWLRDCRELTSAQIGVLYYVRTLDLCGENPLPRATEIARALRLDSATVSRAFKVLGQKGYIDWQPTSSGKSEQQVRVLPLAAPFRHRLQSQLGGLIEDATPAGRIGLLTDTEIIEVKQVSEWKSAMSQLLAYSGFYPQHRKRFHLFGRNGEMLNCICVTVCLELDIIATFEEVQ